MLVVVLQDRVLDEMARRDATSKINWIFAKEGERWAIGVTGSSVTYVGVDGLAIERETGYPTINLGINGSALPEQLTVARHFLSRNTVDCLVLVVGVWDISTSGYSHPYREYDHLPYLHEDVVRRGLVDEYGFRAQLWRWVPGFKYSEFNTKVGLVSAQRLIRGVPSPFDERGADLRSEQMSYEEDLRLRGMEPSELQWSVRRKEAFRELVRVATTKAASVAVVQAPEFGGYQYLVGNRADALEFFEKEAARLAVPFLPTDHLGFVATRSNFYNRNHLNREGADVFRSWLTSELQSRSCRDSLALQQP